MSAKLKGVTDISTHRLGSLFAPTSVAVVGASSRAGRPGYQVLEVLRRFDPTLPIFPITPTYEEIMGIPCFPDIASAPVPDLTIIAGASSRIESDVDAALAHGTKALLIFGAPVPDENRPVWLRRVAQAAKSAGVPLLGPDSLGYVNYAHARGVTWAVPDEAKPGGIAVISQSGTVFWEAITNDPRLRFSFSGHSGLEATLSMADLISYSLSLESTNVIGLYAETVRDADGFAAALAEAADRDIPVVALYAGRTERSRAQLMTHAGRLAGDRSALEAIFRRYGVTRVESPDEWWTTLALLGGERRMGPGGLAAVMDSGGGLAMFLDFAEELNLPVAEISGATKDVLAGLLGYHGELGGAIDFWVGDSDRHAQTQDLLSALIADEGSAAVMAFTTYAEATTAGFATNIADACISVAGQTNKPVISSTYTSRQLYPDLMMRIADAGIPILDGMRTALQAAAHAFAYRDFRAAWDQGLIGSTSTVDSTKLTEWLPALSDPAGLVEADALAFLADFGVPTIPTLRASDESGAVTAAASVGYPVVLKTDEGIAHKASRGGVILWLSDEAAVRDAYQKLAANLGPKVIVAPMAAGLELAIGVVSGQFGPVLMVGSGGVLIEALSGRCYVKCPASPDEVRRAMSGLQLVKVLRASLGTDSQAESDFCELASSVSTVAWAFRDNITELDINPVLVSKHGCVAVDALVGVVSAGQQF